jgi:hypothetical protein
MDGLDDLALSIPARYTDAIPRFAGQRRHRPPTTRNLQQPNCTHDRPPNKKV